MGPALSEVVGEVANNNDLWYAAMVRQDKPKRYFERVVGMFLLWVFIGNTFELKFGEQKTKIKVWAGFISGFFWGTKV